ncbi:MAG: rod shape-determining protein MreC [Clostridiales bacterium]|nr:rod shape-determining protein MreC [Clostridiales bacterium]
MKEFFHSIKFKIIILILSLLLGLMIYVAVSAGAASIPEVILGTITKPFVQLSNAVSNKVLDIIDTWENADNYKKENEELKQKLSEIYGDIIDYESITEENKQLNEILEFKKTASDLVFSPPSSIIARNANDPYKGFTINKGSLDGLSLYDPVMTTLGLVGRITEIAPTYAKVSTIYSPKVKVGVISQRSKASGILENTLEYSDKNQILMSNIINDDDIIVGDLIITSGQGGVFPANQIVGEVIEVFNDSSGLYKNAVISPVNDPDKLINVFCITDFKGKGVDIDTDIN